MGPPNAGPETPRRVLMANPGADLYGSDRMLLETVSALVGHGDSVVVTMPTEGPLSAEVRQRGADVRICRTPVIRKSLLHPLGLARLGCDILRAIRPSLALIRDVDPAVILVNTITPPLWLVMAKVSRRPAVCHVHEGEIRAPWALRMAINLPLLLADQLIVNSEFSKSVLTAAVPGLASRANVVYNSVAGPDRLVLPRRVIDGPWRVLYVGRLSPRKGPQVAIRAVARLRARGVAASLDLVGGVFPGYEWFEHDLRAEVERLHLSDQVYFHGFHRDAWVFREGADIVVVPSTTEEGFGNTAVEGLLAARPVAVSGIGGLIEATAGSSSVVAVPPDDPEALADAINEIRTNWEAYRSRAIEESAIVARRYSSQEYGTRLLEVVDRVVAGPLRRMASEEA